MKVTVFLAGALLFWTVFGWSADYSFPFGQAIELMLSCFKGTVSGKVNKLQKQLQRTEIISQPANGQQVQKLNNLESQAWLYEGVLDRLSSNSLINHRKVAQTLEALEYKRAEILQELEPRKPKRYLFFSSIQKSVRALIASQAAKDHEQLQKIVDSLILFTAEKQPSQTVLSEVVDKLGSKIAEKSNEISPYRLRLAYKIESLIEILSTKLILDSFDHKTDSDYRSALKESRSSIELLSRNGFVA
ncbi:MAG: hypothetical protein WA885_16845 [Phormidesmis sp.]